MSKGHLYHRTFGDCDFSSFTVVIPVLNESEQIVTETVRDLQSVGFEVIVVDDGSLNPHPLAIRHGTNFGYGAAIMTGIANSTKEFIITLDGDGQHSVTEAKKLCAAFRMIECDMLVGARRLEKECWYRYLGRKFLNWTASLLSSYWLNDLNSGMRVFNKKVAFGYREILCKQFSFTTSLTISMLCDGYRVEYFPIKVVERVHGKSRVRVVKHGLITLYYILKLSLALRTRKIRSFLRNVRRPIHAQ